MTPATKTDTTATGGVRDELQAVQFIVVDIGCIECGEASAIVGGFATEAEANTAAQSLWQDYSFTIGQHHYEVFPAPQIGIAAPYADWLVLKVPS